MSDQVELELKFRKLIIFNREFCSKGTCAFVVQESTYYQIETLINLEKRQYLSHYYLDKDIEPMREPLSSLH